MSFKCALHPPNLPEKFPALPKPCRNNSCWSHCASRKPQSTWKLGFPWKPPLGPNSSPAASGARGCDKTPPERPRGSRALGNPQTHPKGSCHCFPCFIFHANKLNKSLGFQLGNSPKELREFWGLQWFGAVCFECREVKYSIHIKIFGTHK